MKTALIHKLGGIALFGALATFGAVASADTVVTESTGTVSEYSPDSLVIHSETHEAPTRYVLGKDVTYVDEAGAPVAVDVIKSGLPVTVHYVREGDRIIANRVVVHRHTAIVPGTVEQRTTTTTITK